MPLLRLSNVSIAYGTHALLKDADFQLDAGERVGLLGRNGEGKSTLMKIIAGNVLPDQGDIWRQPELRLAWLEHSPDLPDDATSVRNDVCNKVQRDWRWKKAIRRVRR